MKKILFMFVAVSVLVVPAWAVINITANPVQVTVNGTPADTDEIVITYEVVGEANLVRAFAFDVTVQDPCGDPDADAHIVDVNTGSLNVDYWVYPGSIDINDAGEVNDVGTPVADYNDLPSDTQLGLGSAGITVEMGSLYVGAPNAPATSGVLLKLVVDDNCLVKMADNVSRGAVVMEGVGSKGPTVYTGTSSAMYTGPSISNWRACGRPKCWCRYQGGRQCHGDADGKPYGKNNYWVSVPEADVFNAANSKVYSDLVDANGVHLVEPTSGIPLICGDADHLPYGKNNYRISVPEADIFNAYNSTSSVDPNCP